MSDIQGTNDSDFILGTDEADIIDALAGDDIVLAGDGDDTVYAGQGNDLVFGDGGNDFIQGGDGDDNLNGGNGINVLLGGDGDDWFDMFELELAQNTIAGGAGLDTLQISVPFETANQSIDLTGLWTGGSGQVGASTVTGIEALADIMTGDGDDTIIVGAGYTSVIGISSGGGNDVLTSGSGNDQLNGGGGIDTMRGGAGNDLYFVDDAGDQVIELAGAGIDTVSAQGDFTLSGNVENLTLGGAGTGTGNALGNRIEGSFYDDVLRGMAGSDTLYGYIGNDRLEGGTGSDRLQGGIGTDTLVGGAGGDRFVWTQDDVYWQDIGIEPPNLDRIGDFRSAEGDLIDLSGLDAILNNAPGALDQFHFRGTKGFSGKAGELRYQSIGSDCLLEADRDGDGLADFSILLENTASIKRSDFILEPRGGSSSPATISLDSGTVGNSPDDMWQATVAMQSGIAM